MDASPPSSEATNGSGARTYPAGFPLVISGVLMQLRFAARHDELRTCRPKHPRVLGRNATTAHVLVGFDAGAVTALFITFTRRVLVDRCSRRVRPHFLCGRPIGSNLRTESWSTDSSRLLDGTTDSFPRFTSFLNRSDAERVNGDSRCVGVDQRGQIYFGRAITKPKSAVETRCARRYVARFPG
jgi:hypothetical protein